MSRDERRIVIFLTAFTAATTLVFACIGRWPQDETYHRFADARTLFAGIPNTLNVLSNLAFALVGVVWLVALARGHHVRGAAEVVFFVGVFATALGSGYYHWHPDDATLVYDRLGMSITFMALLALLIDDRLTHRWRAELLASLVAFGVGSVFYWRATNDLRLYGVTQFFPLLAMPVLLFLPATWSGVRWLVASGAAYVAAKLFERFDAMYFGVVSGHTLKHLAAALSMWCVWRWLRSPAADRPDRSRS